MINTEIQRGKFSLNMSSNGIFTFELTDSRSLLTVVQVEMTPDQLARAMSGRCDQEVPFCLSPRMADVGMVRLFYKPKLPAAEWKEKMGKIPRRDSHNREISVTEFRDDLLQAAIEWMAKNDPEQAPLPWALSSDGIGSRHDHEFYEFTLYRLEKRLPEAKTWRNPVVTVREYFDTTLTPYDAESFTLAAAKVEDKRALIKGGETITEEFMLALALSFLANECNVAVVPADGGMKAVIVPR